MVQVLPPTPTFGGEFGRGLGAALGQSLPARLDQFLQRKRERKESEALSQTLEQLGLAPELSALPPDLQKEFIKQKFQKDKLTDLLEIVGGFRGGEGTGDSANILVNGTNIVITITAGYNNFSGLVVLEYVKT